MLKNYITIAWRNLIRDKSHTVLNIAGLALGITVSLIIGIWLEREVSYDKFHPAGIFRLTNTFKSESESFSQAPSGVAFGAHLTRELPSVKATCRVFYDEFKIKAGSSEYFESGATIVDSNFFHFFGFSLQSGSPGNVLSKHDQIVMTENMAVKYFGRDNPIGKTILLDGKFPMTVSGVAKNAPINSHIQFDILIPYAFLHKRVMDEAKFDIDQMWSGGWPQVYVQLTNPKERTQAEKQINQVAFRFAEKEWKENKMSYQYHLQPIRDIHLKSSLRYDADNNGSLGRVRVFGLVGIFILVLACINYINLTTAGAIRRAKETAVRKVIGAIKSELIRQFLIETLIICSVSVLLGVVLLKLALPWFAGWIGQPYDFPLNLRNVSVLAALVLLISLLAGLYPAAILSSFNPVTTLKGSFAQSTRGNLLRKTLVVLQFTITIALIASIVIISQQMNFIQNKSLGYVPHAILEIDFNGESSVVAKYEAIRTELLRSPYIHNVSKHGQSLVGGLGNSWTTTTNQQGEEVSTSIYQLNVDTSYFDTYGMHLAAGRFFSKDFPTDTTKAVLVNEAALKTFGWPNAERAIGKIFGKGDQARTVIGVIRDFNFETLHKPVDALLIGYSRGGARLSLKIDTRYINEAVNHIKKTWRSSVPDVPLDYTFVQSRLIQQYGNELKMEGVFYVFAALSLLIACLGLFGLSTFVVKRKVKEIGVRKVLGANISGIVTLLSKDFLKLVSLSFVIATPVSWYFMYKWLQEFAYRIDIQMYVFLIAGASALFIALVTVSLQAIKAAMANPVKSLRTE